MAAAAILDFQNLKRLTFVTVKRVELHHRAEFRRNRTAAVRFNIVLVWLENAYSRPFLGFFGGHISSK